MVPDCLVLVAGSGSSGRGVQDKSGLFLRHRPPVGWALWVSAALGSGRAVLWPDFGSRLPSGGLLILHQLSGLGGGSAKCEVQGPGCGGIRSAFHSARI